MQPAKHRCLPDLTHAEPTQPPTRLHEPVEEVKAAHHHTRLALYLPSLPAGVLVAGYQAAGAGTGTHYFLLSNFFSWQCDGVADCVTSMCAVSSCMLLGSQCCTRLAASHPTNDAATECKRQQSPFNCMHSWPTGQHAMAYTKPYLKSTPGKRCRVSSSDCRLSHWEGPARRGMWRSMSGIVAGDPCNIVAEEPAGQPEQYIAA